VDEADADIVAVLLDLEVGDEVVVVYVAFWGSIVLLGDLSQALFEVSDGVLEPRHLGGLLRGLGLDGKGEAVDELAELYGGNVGVAVEGGQDGTGGQR